MVILYIYLHLVHVDSECRYINIPDMDLTGYAQQ